MTARASDSLDDTTLSLEPFGWESAGEGGWSSPSRPGSAEPSSVRSAALVLLVAGLAALATAVVIPKLGKAGADAHPPKALTLVTDGDDRPVAIAAVGLAPETIEALRTEFPDETKWAGLLSVDGPEGPVAGSWAIAGERVLFFPDRPLRRDVAYRVRWAGGSASELVPARDGERSPTYVMAVHPSTDLVPSNLTRIAIDFSGPMRVEGSNGESSLDHVSLLAEDGRSVSLSEAGILPTWNEDRTRLLVPLRGRSGGGEREDLLADGRRYRLQIHRTWRDDRGLPLGPFEGRVLLARGHDREAPEWTDFRLRQPESDRGPVTLDFPEPLDHLSLRDAFRVVEVESGDEVAGSGRLSNADTRWTFVPERPWQPGRPYVLQLRGRVLDLAGHHVVTTGSTAGMKTFQLSTGRSTGAS